MDKPKFINITTTDFDLFALDESGEVWKYYPERKPKTFSITDKGRFAFWGKLTSHRADPNK